MAYARLIWLDDARSPSRTFSVTENDDGTITLTRAGTVIQEGTNLSAENFNNAEEGIFAANLSAAEALRLIRLLQDSVDTVSENSAPYIVEADFTNTYSYPFNNSEATVAISDSRDNTDYFVVSEVTEYAGGEIGNIVISDKMVNGFKAAYTGSATSATIKFYIVGGMAV